MVQGFRKQPTNPFKGKQKKKVVRPKKGAKTIAPKKAQKVESQKLQKKMQKAINTNIHKEICQRAGADHVQLAVVGKTESKKKN